MSTGRLITVEGIDGCGKSTQVEHVASHLRKQGVSVTLVREPGGTAVGEACRESLLHGAPGDRSPLTDLFLISAARAQLFAEVVEPALAAGEWVVSDRGMDSTFSYQGFGSGVPLDLISHTTSVFRTPDLTFFLDVGVDQAVERRKRRSKSSGEALDRFEEEKTDFFLRVREGFIIRCFRHPDRIISIDGRQNARAVSSSISSALDNFLSK